MKRLISILFFISFCLFLSMSTFCQTTFDDGNSKDEYNRKQIYFSWWNDYDGYRHTIKTRHYSNSVAENAIDFYTWQPNDGTNGIGSKHNMSLFGGNVGIGITDPTYRLEVDGKLKVYDNIMLNGHWLSHDGGDKGIYISESGDIMAEGNILLNDDHAIEFVTNNTRIFEENSGNNLSLTANDDIIFRMDDDIYIRTGDNTTDWIHFNNGEQELSIDGDLYVEDNIWATEISVAVTNPYADFVFEKNYHLMPLDELKNFIEQNGHLPDMPTEAEVVNSGLDLGKMNILLLQKIEELTLYLIEQNEKILELTKKNK